MSSLNLWGNYEPKPKPAASSNLSTHRHTTVSMHSILFSELISPRTNSVKGTEVESPRTHNGASVLRWSLQEEEQRCYK